MKTVTYSTVDPAGRTRGHYEQHTYISGYDIETDESWEPSPNGPFIRSTLPAIHGMGAVHAPIYDVDQPVDAHRTDNGTRLEFATVTRRAMTKARRRLNRLGMLDRSVAESLSTVTLNVPIRAVASKTPGHVHLYVDVPMSFRTSVRLAKALPGLVDPKHITISRKSREWLARVA